MKRVTELESKTKRLENALNTAMRALVLTQDYTLFPAQDGWEWYEACKTISAQYPNLEWSKQFLRRYDQSTTGG